MGIVAAFMKRRGASKASQNRPRPRRLPARAAHMSEFLGTCGFLRSSDADDVQLRQALTESARARPTIRQVLQGTVGAYGDTEVGGFGSGNSP
jgi:hypothetical protein